jgi:DNA-directed RNA polymerase subunit RPC12/RpoP
MITLLGAVAIAFTGGFGTWGIFKLKEGVCRNVEESQIEDEQPQQESQPITEVCKSHSNDISEYSVSASQDQPLHVSHEPQIEVAKETEQKEEKHDMGKHEEIRRLVDAEKKRREQIENSERQREREKEEKLRREVLDRQIRGRELFALRIDIAIRSKKSFTSADPLNFEWDVNNIAAEFEPLRPEYNKKYCGAIPESTREFIRSHRRFVIPESNSSKVKLAYLTPYQGSGKVSGKYECSNCSKPWTSAASTKNIAASCKNCGKSVYPKSQTVPESELIEETPENSIRN